MTLINYLKREGLRIFFPLWMIILLLFSISFCTIKINIEKIQLQEDLDNYRQYVSEDEYQRLVDYARMYRIIKRIEETHPDAVKKALKGMGTECLLPPKCNPC